MREQKKVEKLAVIKVQGKGKIVKKDWIENSFAERKKLNWKLFSLTKVNIIIFLTF